MTKPEPVPVDGLVAEEAARVRLGRDVHDALVDRRVDPDVDLLVGVGAPGHLGRDDGRGPRRRRPPNRGLRATEEC